MKKITFIRRCLCFLLVLILMTTSVHATETENDMSISQGCRTVNGQIPLMSPQEEISETDSALLYDVTNDTLIYATNPDAPVNPAGLVKIMTAYVVAELGNMEDSATVNEESLNAISSGSRMMEFFDGEVIPMVDVMYCLLVGGIHEAAVIAAEHVSGTQEAFVQEMNRYAEELGCTGTNFTNVHGLHDNDQVTTARDMAKILSAAIKNEYFWEAFSTYVVRIPATNKSEEKKISSESFVFNQNLGSNHFDRRVTGSRTGTTAFGKRNIIVTAEKNDTELISVVLGSVSPINPNGKTGFYKEARILLDYGFDNYAVKQVLHENEVVEQFKIENGDCDVSACVNTSTFVSLPLDISPDHLVYRYKQNKAQLQAPIQAGDDLGTVFVWYQNICLAQADMFALHDVSVEETTVSEQISEERETSAVTLLMIVAVIVGLLVILLFGRKVIFHLIRRHRIHRHKADRRRRH